MPSFLDELRETGAASLVQTWERDYYCRKWDWWELVPDSIREVWELLSDETRGAIRYVAENAADKLNYHTLD